MTREDAEKRLAELKPKVDAAWEAVKQAREDYNRANDLYWPIASEAKTIECFLKVVDK